MFKAKLIDDPGYYSITRKLILLGLVGGILSGIWFISIETPLGWMVLLPAFGFATWRMWINRKAADMVRNRKIEITPEMITVKSRQGKIMEAIPMDSVSQITLKDTYRLPDETVQDLVQSLKGKSIENFVILHAHNREFRFDFALDSHFMIGQLKKVVSEWQKAGTEITWVA